MTDHRKALRESLRDATGTHADDQFSELHTEIDRDDPRPAHLAALVERMKHHPDLGERISLWWNDPKTQMIMNDITSIGL